MSKPIFQAIGVIDGVVEFIDEKAFVYIINHNVGKQPSTYAYPLFFLNKRKTKKAYELLKEKVESGVKNFRLLVYPQTIHYPRKKDSPKPMTLGFALVAFTEDLNSQVGIFGKLNPMEFKFAGVYQRIPVCSIPCLTIYRNYNETRLKKLKAVQPIYKVRAMKALHIPIFWKESPIKPFSFNQREPEKSGQTFFVQCLANFLPHKNAFGFKSLISTSEKIPRFLKVDKQTKIEAIRQKIKVAK